MEIVTAILLLSLGVIIGMIVISNEYDIDFKSVFDDAYYFGCKMGKAEYEAAQKQHDTEIRNKAIEDFLCTAEKKITETILQHQAQLDFASGLAVANRMLDDVAEELKTK